MNQIVANQHRFKLLSPEEVMELPDPQWIIKGVLPAEVVAQCYGPSGHFKSFVTLDMALTVASGRKWLGKTETIHSKVIYVAGEGVVGYKKRIKAWLQDNGLNISEIQDSFRFLAESLPLGSVLDCEVFMHKVKEFVGDTQVDLIVLDTQARCTTGIQENDNTEMGLVVEQLDRLKNELKTTVMLVHHTGKFGDRM